MKPVTQREIDELLTESQRLRDELLKTAGRLEAFADQLSSQVAELRDAARVGTQSDQPGD